jgi:ferric-dicitrate binding protein FerR (iron transport regulator)
VDKDETSRWELTAAKLNGELNQEESSAFDESLKNTSGEIPFSKVSKIHQGLKEIAALRNTDKETSWNYISDEIKVKRLRRVGFSLLKYAAVVVLAFISGFYFYQLNGDSLNQTQYAQVEVMYGQTGHLFLFDGTEVWLNSGTRIKYPNRFNRDERNVYIDGEAYFKVKPDKHLPFKVKTSQFEVEVFGTSFNVSAYSNEPEQSVVLVEGKVQINNTEGKKLNELKPGQLAVKTSGDQNIKIEETETYMHTCWKEGKVVFEGEQLGEIVQKMERWYNVKISFEQEELKEYKFSGTILRNKPIDQTIMAMELLAPIKFSYLVKTDEKNEIIIRKK